MTAAVTAVHAIPPTERRAWWPTTNAHVDCTTRYPANPANPVRISTNARCRRRWLASDSSHTTTADATISINESRAEPGQGDRPGPPRGRPQHEDRDDIPAQRRELEHEPLPQARRRRIPGPTSHSASVPAATVRDGVAHPR